MKHDANNKNRRKTKKQQIRLPSKSQRTVQKNQNWNTQPPHTRPRKIRKSSTENNENINDKPSKKR